MSCFSIFKKRTGMDGAKTSAEVEIIRRVKRSEEDELHGELLEGIPNDVTLIGIAAKLPYRAWSIARSLSPDWQRAFEDGLVYDARVRSQATQTFVAVSFWFLTVFRVCFSLEKRTISLFSPNEQRWYKLPPISGCLEGMPSDSHIVALDSSIYVLGGTRSGDPFPSAKVFVLDLAMPPLERRRCADMQVPRQEFSVGVLCRKLFVFGYPMNEAYDPKLDTWSSIAQIKAPGSGSGDNYCYVTKTWTVGQLFVCMTKRPENLLWGPEDNTCVPPDDMPPSSVKRLFVRAGAKGPFLDLLSPNHRFAVDQMDGLHEIVYNQRFDKVTRLPLPRTSAAGSHLASCFEADDLYRRHLSPSWTGYWTYNPSNDHWEMYENRDVDANTVESWDYNKDLQMIHSPMVPFQRRRSSVYTDVWTMSF